MNYWYIPNHLCMTCLLARTIREEILSHIGSMDEGLDMIQPLVVILENKRYSISTLVEFLFPNIDYILKICQWTTHVCIQTADSIDGPFCFRLTPRTPGLPLSPRSAFFRPPLLRQKSSVHFARQASLPSGRPMNRQFSRQVSRQLSRTTSVMSDTSSHTEETPAQKKRRFTRQITIADDECHPPDALMAKVKEVDKLIKAEGTETGRVRQLFK